MKKILLLLATFAFAAAFAQAPADTYVFQTIGGGPVSLDPVRAYDTASSTILENVYETLYTYKGTSIDEFEPALATGYTVSEDGTSYTFTLRDGVQFHSGNTLSCKDVEWSYEYGLVVAHPEGAINYLIGDQLVGTQTNGADPAAYMEEVTFQEIDDAVVCPDGPDGMTVQFNFTRPEPAFIAIQAYTAFSIVDSQWAMEHGMWNGTEETWQDWIGRDVTQEYMHDHVSGTGAYQLVEWEDAVIATKFDNYWGEPANIENVVIEYVDEIATRILNVKEGAADRITLGERAQLVQLRGAPGVVIHEDPSWSDAGVTVTFFNYDIDTENNEDVGSGQLDGSGIPSDFFTDVNVRRGFAHLFDHEQFIQQIYNGEGQKITMGLPPTFLGYNEDIPIRGLDLELAEEYFRAAFDGELWEKGFTFTALYNAGNSTRQAALEIIESNLEFLNPNFNMDVRSLPWADFLARTGQKKAPMFVLGWAADYADPKNFINTFYACEGFYSARTSICFPEMQDLIDQANTITDPEARAFLYEQIGSLHYELAPLIALPAANPFIVTSDRLEGVYYNTMLSHAYKWKDISLSSN